SVSRKWVDGPDLPTGIRPGFHADAQRGRWNLPDHSNRRERTSAGTRAAAVVSRVVGWPLGRRHAGRRGDELQRQAVARRRQTAANLVGCTARRRTLEPARWADARLPGSG